MDVGPGLTFRQAFEALVEVMERDAAASSSSLANELGRLQEHSLRCSVGGSTVASEESQSEVNLDFRYRTANDLAVTSLIITLRSQSPEPARRRKLWMPLAH